MFGLANEGDSSLGLRSWFKAALERAHVDGGRYLGAE